MVKYYPGLDHTFSALSHPIRRGILARLARGEATVAELARPYRVSAPAITKHLRILEKARLIAQGRRGRERPCSLVPGRLKEAEAWIRRYKAEWEERLDNLERFLRDNP